MSSSVINEHPYSARSQSQIVRSNNSKSNRENVKPTTSRSMSVPQKPIFPPRTTRSPLIEKKSVTNQKASHYDQQTYLSNKNVYPTLRKVDNSANGILKKKISQRTSKLKDPVKWSNENANPNNDDPVRTVKFFSGSTKSIKYLSKKFRENSQNPKLKHAGAFIFEIIAILDSSISESGRKNSKEFTVRDSFDRMHCIFSEIDMNLKKFIRGSYMRLTGLYNVDLNLFNCYSVRQATQHEIFTHEQNVSVSNAFIKKTFL